MFSDHDETSPSIAAVSALSAACSMLAVATEKALSPNRWRVRMHKCKKTFRSCAFSNSKAQSFSVSMSVQYFIWFHKLLA